jgi:hypothetical protein
MNPTRISLRVKRLANRQMPLILTAALIGLAGEALGLPFEFCVITMAAWQVFSISSALNPGRP